LWTAELEDTTRRTYAGYIERTIHPAVGDVAIDRLTARTLETLYGQLRRCRVRCDGRPSIEHRADGEHDCARSKCRPHTCRPMAASTVRQIHSIISATLSAAVRWEWISSNPARVAQRPRAKAPEPNPPSAADAARLLDAAFALDDDWGTLVWLVMTTGMRRGEVCALRWRDIDFDAETVEVRRSYILHRGVGVEKGTKTHQMRRIALDSETVVLLRESRDRVRARLELLGACLGHGGGGATTLKVYAAWVAASDRRAAELLRRRLPVRRPKFRMNSTTICRHRADLRMRGDNGAKRCRRYRLRVRSVVSAVVAR
jgi:integrase